MNEFEKKKLLILSGNSMSEDIVTCAQEMGAYVIVTDWYDENRSPAKKIANEAWQISVSEYDLLAEKIKENQIDGVLTGFTDSYLEHYYHVCEKAGLPCYGTMHQFGIGADKMLFKQACRKAGVGVIPGDNAFSFEEVQKISKETGYPLILKPVDNSGSRGVIKCEREEDLKLAYEYALSFSPSKNVMCERFMDCENVSGCYQLVDGEAYLSLVHDRHIYKSDNGSSITGGSYAPSKYLQRYIDEVDPAFKKMLRDEGFKNGVLSFQAFVDEEAFYMCEICYRVSGGRHYVFTEYETGVNGLKLLIEFALSGKVSNYDSTKETPFLRMPCAMVKIVGEPKSKICKMEGFEEARKLEGVIKLSNAYSVGGKTGRDGTTAQVLGTLWIAAENRAKLQELLDKVKETLIIEDADGNSLIRHMKFMN